MSVTAGKWSCVLLQVSHLVSVWIFSCAHFLKQREIKFKTWFPVMQFSVCVCVYVKRVKGCASVFSKSKFELPHCQHAYLSLCIPRWLHVNFLFVKKNPKIRLMSCLAACTVMYLQRVSVLWHKYGWHLAWDPLPNHLFCLNFFFVLKLSKIGLFFM